MWWPGSRAPVCIVYVKLFPWVTFNGNTLRVTLVYHSENAEHSLVRWVCVCARWRAEEQKFEASLSHRDPATKPRRSCSESFWIVSTVHTSWDPRPLGSRCRTSVIRMPAYWQELWAGWATEPLEFSQPRRARKKPHWQYGCGSFIIVTTVYHNDYCPWRCVMGLGSRCEKGGSHRKVEFFRTDWSLGRF